MNLIEGASYVPAVGRVSTHSCQLQRILDNARAQEIETGRKVKAGDPRACGLETSSGRTG